MDSRNNLPRRISRFVCMTSSSPCNRIRRGAVAATTAAGKWLLFGVIITVAISWLCAVLHRGKSPELASQFVATERNGWYVCDGCAAGANRVVLTRSVWEVGESQDIDSGAPVRTRCTVPSDDRSYRMSIRLTERTDDRVLYVSVWSFGLPCRAMTYGARRLSGGATEVVGGLRIGPMAGPLQFGSMAALPHYIIWDGFLINIVFCAIVPSALVACLRGIRRRYRRGHDNCGVCKYPITGIVGGRCPECGASTGSTKNIVSASRGVTTPSEPDDAGSTPSAAR